MNAVASWRMLTCVSGSGGWSVSGQSLHPLGRRHSQKILRKQRKFSSYEDDLWDWVSFYSSRGGNEDELDSPQRPSSHPRVPRMTILRWDPFSLQVQVLVQDRGGKNTLLSQMGINPMNAIQNLKKLTAPSVVFSILGFSQDEMWFNSHSYSEGWARHWPKGCYILLLFDSPGTSLWCQRKEGIGEWSCPRELSQRKFLATKPV